MSAKSRTRHCRFRLPMFSYSDVVVVVLLIECSSSQWIDTRVPVVDRSAHATSTRSIVVVVVLGGLVFVARRKPVCQTVRQSGLLVDHIFIIGRIK
jgi:hypothetical protein